MLRYREERQSKRNRRKDETLRQLQGIDFFLSSFERTDSYGPATMNNGFCGGGGG